MISTKKLQYTFLLTLALSVLLSFFLIENKSSLILRGDFPAFYAAAHQVNNEPALLYDQVRQGEVQNKYWPSLEGEFLPFAYPPFVAQLLSPLAFLSPVSAKLLTILLLTLALFGAARLLGLLRGSDPLTEFCYLLACGPVFISLMAGQNTALSMLLLSCILFFSSRVSSQVISAKSSEFFWGVCVALLFFKPQLALAQLFLLFALGKFRGLFAACLLAVCLYLLAAFQFGVSWPLEWLQLVRGFGVDDSHVNSSKLIHLSSIAPLLGASLASEVIWGIYFLALCLLGFFARFLRSKLSSEELVALAAIISLLFSPHTMFYDAGFGFLAFFAIRRSETLMIPLLVCIAVATALIPTVSALTLSALLLLCFLSYFFRLKLLFSNSSSE